MFTCSQVNVGDRYPLLVVVDHGRGVVGGWLQLLAIPPLWILAARHGDRHGEWLDLGAV